MPNHFDLSVKSVLLSCFPLGTQVLQAQSYRPDYLSFPMCVHLKMPDGDIQRCVVKINQPSLVEREVQVLRLLAGVGLAVPKVLAEPVPLPLQERTMVVLSVLPGRSLPWCGITSLAESDLACRLTLEGVAQLHHLTSRVQEVDAASLLPQNTLSAEYAATIAEAEEWRNIGIFQQAVEAVGGTLAEVATPLVFSNGDYNPLNFLCDGQALCGFVDFEGACFENPHIGFVKFLVWSRDEYGWGTGKKAGIVERYLYTRNVSRRAFAPILVLRCLRHLIREVSPADSKDMAAHEHIAQLIAEGVQSIEQG